MIYRDTGEENDRRRCEGRHVCRSGVKQVTYFPQEAFLLWKKRLNSSTRVMGGREV